MSASDHVASSPRLVGASAGRQRRQPRGAGLLAALWPARLPWDRSLVGERSRAPKTHREHRGRSKAPEPDRRERRERREAAGPTELKPKESKKAAGSAERAGKDDDGDEPGDSGNSYSYYSFESEDQDGGEAKKVAQPEAAKLAGFKDVLFSMYIYIYLYGIRCFPLTKSIIFQDGYCTTSQILWW